MESTIYTDQHIKNHGYMEISPKEEQNQNAGGNIKVKDTG